MHLLKNGDVYLNFKDLWQENRDHYPVEGRWWYDVVYDENGSCVDYTGFLEPCPQPTDLGITLLTCWTWLRERYYNLRYYDEG
jgi:hypothetical protein